MTVNATGWPATTGLGLHSAAALPSASVEIDALALAYGGRAVLRGLDWRLLPGQVVGLLGRNGAGKTTLLESLLGLRDADAGRVRLFGQPVTALDDAGRARIGYVPQQADLFEWLTASQLLGYFRSFYPRWNEAKVEGLLSRWDIPRELPVARLSGGQQQRLAIVRALAHEPDLLVLDEPVASLDPAGRRDFLRELVEQVLDRGTTVVFSTHILSDLERVAFNVAFLGQGRIVLQAPLDELIETTRRLSGPGATVRALVQRHRLVPLRSEPIADGQVDVLARGAEPDRGWPAGGDGVAVSAVTLEDLFMALTA